MNKDIKSQPILKQYIHLTQYFEDYFKFRKFRDSKFSYEVWAAELGFKSRSYLRMISKGSRSITLQFIKIFSDKMNFTADEQEYMTFMAFYSKAKSPTQKKIYMDKILDRIDPEQNRLEIDNYTEFLSSPHLMSLLLIISFEDVIATEANLKNLLGLKAIEIKRHLKTLQKLKLITQKKAARYGQDIWVSNSRAIKISDKAKDAALLKFHMRTLVEAREILENDPEFRRFRSIYFSVPENQLDDLSHEVESFLKKMRQKFGSNQLHGKNLVKMNLQTYPVSRTHKK